MDNLIFLHKENHLGSHGKYDDQIIEIMEDISIRDLDDAVEILKDEIGNIRTKLSDEIIGKPIKINTITL